MVVFILGRRNKPSWFEKIRPDKVDGQEAIRTTYYKSIITRIIKGCFEVECPKDWNFDYLLDLLLFRGYVVITNTSAGILPLESSLTGYNYANFPTQCMIALPILGEFTRELEKDAELVYLEWDRTRMFFNFQETVRIFAEKLASCDAAIDVNVMNSRLAYLAEAESKSQARTIKNLFDKITNGEPLVVYRSDSVNPQSLNLLTNNLKQNYIAIDVQDTKRTIINELLTSLGVNNANTDKKERLLTEEVESNSEELAVNIRHFERTLKRCTERVNEMFPNIPFKIKLKYDSRTREDKKNDSTRTDRDVDNPTSAD